MDPLVLKKLNESRKSRKAAVVVTNLADGRDRLVTEGESVEGELGEAVANAFRTGKAACVTIGGIEFFLNAHLPPPRIVVIGAVHISQALASICETTGYAIEVIDPRTAFATEERFTGIFLFPEWPEDVLQERPLDRYCALAAVTHDPKIDDYAIQAGLEADCFYVGALGSRKTHSKRVERLANAGVSTRKLDRIRAPIGLNIGASSPQEIAVAIMAEIVSAFRSREVGSGR